MSRYDAADDYVYPGTTVLRNKADIQEQAALDAFEANATAVRMRDITPIIRTDDLDGMMQKRTVFRHIKLCHYADMQRQFVNSLLTKHHYDN